MDYVWGGTDPSKGLDCSGLVQRAYRDLGIELPRVSYDQAKVGTKVDSIEQARPGDLVAFGSPVDHIGIYVGDGKMIQAPHTGDVVRISDIKRPITAIRRVIPDDAASASGINATSLAAATGRATTTGGSTGISGAEPYEQLFQAAGAKYGLNLPPRRRRQGGSTSTSAQRAAVGPCSSCGDRRGMGIDPTDPTGGRRRSEVPAHPARPVRLGRPGARRLQRRSRCRATCRRHPPYAEDATRDQISAPGQPVPTSPTLVGSTNGVLT